MSRPRKACLVLVGLLVGLLVAEVIVRISGVDWRHIRRLVSSRISEAEVHQADPDPGLIYTLRPGAHHGYSHDYGSFTVSVNALGFRGPERSAAKPQGVFRILCFGGSNVYGAGVDDHETWPARLEAILNSEAPGRYEVWNGGVSAYVSQQMARAASKAIKRFQPDLIIFAMSNVMPRHFSGLQSDISYYFQRDPTLWSELLPRQQLDPGGRPDEMTRWLLQHAGLYRLGLAMWLIRQRQHGHLPTRGDFPHDIRVTREFLGTASAKVPMMIFICPAAMRRALKPYHQGLNLPLFVLTAENKAAAYRQIHPPPEVLRWYAERLAAQLKKLGLVPAT